MQVEDLQEIFAIQRHQVIELLHNSYYGLVKDDHSRELSDIRGGILPCEDVDESGQVK